MSRVLGLFVFAVGLCGFWFVFASSEFQPVQSFLSGLALGSGSALLFERNV